MRAGRTGRRRAVSMAGLLVALVSGFVALPGRDARVDGVAGAALALALPRNAADAPVLDPGPPDGRVTYLVVGSDRREGMSRDLPALGDLTGEQADTVMLWSVVPGQELRVLSLPRDLRVDVPGRGARKLGTTLGYGPAPLVDAVRELTGQPVNHLVVLDFEGFAGAVDAVGGVRLTLAYPVRDRVTGLQLPAGRVDLDGATALRFVRSRQAQELRGGRWRPATGDLTRIKRQQRVLTAVVGQLRSDGGIGTLLRVGRRAVAGVTVDATFGGHDAGRLLALADRTGRASVTTCTLPSVRQVPGTLGASPFPPQHDGSTVFRVVDGPRAAGVLAWFRAGTAGAPAPACDGED